jgi:hypothetical protein
LDCSPLFIGAKDLMKMPPEVSTAAGMADSSTVFQLPAIRWAAVLANGAIATSAALRNPEAQLVKESNHHRRNNWN